jgi:endonuclease YncB( thermonuclease family)
MKRSESNLDVIEFARLCKVLELQPGRVLAQLFIHGLFKVASKATILVSMERGACSTAAIRAFQISRHLKASDRDDEQHGDESLMRRLMIQLLALALLISGCRVHADGAVLTGTVIRVIDGDTIDVQLASGRVRVRMNGVDTPERGQPWGKDAKAALTQLVMSKIIQLEPFRQDRYERMVANVLVGNLDVNAELVRQGHAWAYRQYLTRDNVGLCSLEANAREAKRGLWALPPKQRYARWDWRKRPKQFVDYSRATAEQCLSATPAAARKLRADGAVKKRAVVHGFALPTDMRSDAKRNERTSPTATG